MTFTTPAAARRAALRGLIPDAILQSIPLPKGTVMLLAPLAANAPTFDAETASLPATSSSAAATAPLGDFLFASRSTLHSLRPWHKPKAICRRLLRPTIDGRSAGGDERSAEHEYRVGIAWGLALTYGIPAAPQTRGLLRLPPPPWSTHAPPF